MGLNICVTTLDEALRREDIERRYYTMTQEERAALKFEERDHPDWDALRTPGDREFVSISKTLPQRIVEVGRETLTRPQNFAAWRAAIDASDLPDKARFHHLMKLLECDENQYIIFSW